MPQSLELTVGTHSPLLLGEVWMGAGLRNWTIQMVLT